MHGWIRAAALIAALGTGNAAQAATYFTSTSGSDSRSCDEAKSASAAKRTVSSGASCLQPGDVLIVAGGVYNESLINNLPSGTSWSAPVKDPFMCPKSSLSISSLGMAAQFTSTNGLAFWRNVLVAPLVLLMTWSRSQLVGSAGSSVAAMNWFAT